MSAQKSILFKARLVFGFPLLFAASIAWAEGGGGSDAANNGSGSCSLNDELKDLPTEAQAPAGQIAAQGGQPVTAELQSWGEKRTQCKNKNYDAQKECLEACSKNAQKGLGGAKAISGLMNIISGLTNKTCGQQQQAANQMKDGYEGYSAACKATQSACNTSCGDAENAARALLQKAGSACQGVTDPGKQAACTAAAKQLVALVQQDAGKEAKLVGGKVDQCKRDFSNRLAGAAEVLQGIGQMLSQGQQCEEESVADTGATKSCSELSEAERMQRQDCICEISSFNPGCENAGGSSNSPTFGGSEFSTSNPDVSSNVEASTPKADPNLFPNSGSGAGGGAGAAGMYAGGSGGAPGAMAASSADKEEDKKKQDANIFGGEGGGGGGGGSWGFGSASSADANGKGSGAGAGMRGLAGKPADPTLTGAGGRDNWQKVKLRYSDNRPTFLDEQ